MSIEWTSPYVKFENPDINIFEIGFDFDRWLKKDASIEDLKSELSVLELLRSSLESINKKAIEKDPASENALKRINGFILKIKERLNQLEK